VTGSGSKGFAPLFRCAAPGKPWLAASPNRSAGVTAHAGARVVLDFLVSCFMRGAVDDESMNPGRRIFATSALYV
jgi:hypothetical protein